eukprot:TRINITY_DN80406_c0_g1_i1.p1 TRINITY_DN80406_c0_g1~~TRINITY_DN80406_c0_g1_i1.p1  ORF type:complete len:448 (-),score=110.80 TRINITY_DN80406_c0_g1_i1:113-1456(-)
MKSALADAALTPALLSVSAERQLREDDLAAQARLRKESRLASSASTCTSVSIATTCHNDEEGEGPGSGRSPKGCFLQGAACIRQVRRSRGSWADQDCWSDDDVWEVGSSPCGGGAVSTDLAEDVSSLRSVDTSRSSCGASTRSYAASETASVAASEGLGRCELNAATSEFIPTMSAVCPLVGVYCFAVPEEASCEAEAAAWPTLAEASSTSRASGAASSRGARAAWSSASPYFGGFMGATHWHHPATASAAQALYGGGAFGGYCEPSHASSSGPRRRGAAAAKKKQLHLATALEGVLSGSAVEKQQLQDTAEDAEEVSEETWQRREAVRQRAVELAKATREYRWHQHQNHEDDEPQTPDWRDRSISKRQWKHRVMQWRTNFAQRYLDEMACAGSAASTEEGGSSTGACVNHTESEAGGVRRAGSSSCGWVVADAIFTRGASTEAAAS